MPALYDARSAKDDIINALKEKEAVQVEKLEALKAKREVHPSFCDIFVTISEACCLAPPWRDHLTFA